MKKWHRFTRVLVSLLALGGATLAHALPAAAQEFVKVEEGAGEHLPATPFVAIAYGFIWLALLLYTVTVARGLGRVQRELDDVRRRLDRAGTNVPGSSSPPSPR